jgi:hypothetical protein
VWRDVDVKMENDTFVVYCSKGAMLLIESQYKQKLIDEIKPFCDKPVEFRKVVEKSDSDLDKQLNSLGDNVRFESNKK